MEEYKEWLKNKIYELLEGSEYEIAKDRKYLLKLRIRKNDAFCRININYNGKKEVSRVELDSEYTDPWMIEVQNELEILKEILYKPPADEVDITGLNEGETEIHNIINNRFQKNNYTVHLTKIMSWRFRYDIIVDNKRGQFDVIYNSEYKVTNIEPKETCDTLIKQILEKVLKG